MKTLVNMLAGAVRRAPAAVIVVTVVISLALGALSGSFQPEEDSNASFAPEAPELDAAERITELFGQDSNTSVMQVIISSEGGNVFSVSGLEAVAAVEARVRAGAFADILAEPDDPAAAQQNPAIISFASPVLQAVAQGQPPPASDADVQRAYLGALAQIPLEQAGLLRQLLPADANADNAVSDKGLMIIITTGAENADVYDQFVDLSALASAEIDEIQLPDGLSAEAFSFELLFADQDEFQNEILRLLGTAVLIIGLVLAGVFLIAPSTRRARIWMVGGFAVIVTGITLSILPTLAKILDSVFPDAIAEWPSGLIFGVVALGFLVMLGVWTFVATPLRRTSADVLVTLATIFFAISWMNGIGYLVFGDASPMAQILPILLIGLGVDYSIHVTSRYREELASGRSVDDAIDRAIRTVGVALVLATITTAVGFLTNLFSEIPALREFGLLAAVGIGASFVLMLTFVPAVRELLDRRGARVGTLDPALLASGESRALPRIIGRTSWLARRVPAGVLVVSLGLGGLGFYGFTELNAEFSFLDFVPTTSPLRSTFETLLEDFGGGFGENTQILVEGDVATAQAWNAMVEANERLAQTDNVVTFAGSPAGTSPIAAVGTLAAAGSPAFAPEVAAAVAAAGLDPASFRAPPGADVGSVYDAAYEADPAGLAAVLVRAEPGRYEAALFDMTTQAGEAGANQLRDDVAAAFEPVVDAGISAIGTSDEIINDVVVTTLRDSQFSSLIITLIAALILLVINFAIEARRPMLGVITTLPVVLVVLLSFAIMAGLGIPFGPITATISALAIGIGIPYMIHITHRYLEDRGRHGTAEGAIASTLTHTGGALAGSALTTVAGFGILVTSTTIPFRQFGFVTAYTILLAMLAAVLVLPSALVLWDRWHRTRGEDPFDAVAFEAALTGPPEMSKAR